jgi:hypothetical protein
MKMMAATSSNQRKHRDRPNGVVGGYDKVIHKTPDNDDDDYDDDSLEEDILSGGYSDTLSNDNDDDDDDLDSEARAY